MSSPGSATGLRVADAGERALIERIRTRVPPGGSSLVVGIGDDAAVAMPDRGALQVLTTDALVVFPWDKQVYQDGQWQIHPELVGALALQKVKQ